MKKHVSEPPAVCFYFQVHQPYRLKDLRITDIGSMIGGYFDTDKNRAIFRKVADKCYLPANRQILNMLKRHPELRVAYSLSGVFLDQCKEYGTDVLDSFKRLAETGQVEFLGETYHHSLSALFSLREFCEQVETHAKAIKKLFGKLPTVFRNTELVYNNEIAEVARLLGFKGILAEGADHVLRGRTPNELYVPPSFDLPFVSRKIASTYAVETKPKKKIHALLKNYRLSDDIAFRFSHAHANGKPLLAETFADWVRACEGTCVNLFMDYETFGEHQWADTGIFKFLEALPEKFRERGIRTLTPSGVVKEFGSKENPALDVHHPMSWADTERDLSAWRGNHLQEAALAGIYALESAVRKTKSPKLLETWRRLQTSDHFYYLSTKYWSDGDVHKYFSPYESPYEAFRRYAHALEDLKQTLTKAGSGKRVAARKNTKKRSKKSSPSSKR